MHADMALLKCILLTQPLSTWVGDVAENASGKTKVPEPKKFKGYRSAKDLDNQIEHHPCAHQQPTEP